MLRAEVARLELLVKKVQTELQLEREYNQALEKQIHTLINDELILLGNKSEVGLVFLEAIATLRLSNTDSAGE